MNKLTRRAALFGLAIAVLPGPPAIAQEPSLRIVFPFAAGGSADALARMIAEQLHKDLGRPVIVENKPGAGGASAPRRSRTRRPTARRCSLRPARSSRCNRTSSPSWDTTPSRTSLPLQGS
jgi:tripartite-type tricarboxylate transporter receptor subunit TctC